MVKVYCKLLVWGFNIKVHLQGHQPTEGSYLIICNHCSYWDVIILNSLFKNVCFITSKDMEESFFLGTITKCAISYAVERRNRSKIEQDVEAMKNILLDKINVLLFPEGRTGPGTELLRFKYPLFEAAIRANRPVLPICLNYTKIDNKPLTKETNSQVCWHRVPIVKHFFRFTKIKRLDCEVIFTNIIKTEGKNPSDLSLETREQIEKVFKPAR